MELTAFNGRKIENLDSKNGKISFTSDIDGIVAKIEVENINEIFKNDELIENLESQEMIIDNIDLEVVEFDEDTFSEAIIKTENGDIFVLKGDMKGTLLNKEEFEYFIQDSEDEDFDDFDED